MIEKEQMYVENANRAVKGGRITVDNLEPYPKNPIIAAFFRNIGYADQLGSGVRKLFKYSQYYSGKIPEFIEGDIFRIIVPLNEGFSFDFWQENCINGISEIVSDTISDTIPETISNEKNLKKKLLIYIGQDSARTQKEYAAKLKVSVATVKRLFAKLQKEKILAREGTNRKGKWIITKQK